MEGSTSVEGPICEVESALHIDVVVRPMALTDDEEGEWGEERRKEIRGRRRYRCICCRWRRGRFPSRSSCHFPVKESQSIPLRAVRAGTHPLAGEDATVEVVIGSHALRLVFVELAVVEVAVLEGVSPFQQ